MRDYPSLPVLVNLDENMLPDPIRVEINGHQLWLDARHYTVGLELRTARLWARERQLRDEIVLIERRQAAAQALGDELLRIAATLPDKLRGLEGDELTSMSAKIDQQIGLAETAMKEAEALGEQAIDVREKSRTMVAEHLETIIHPKGLPEEEQANTGWTAAVIMERISIQAQGRLIGFFEDWAPRLKRDLPKSHGGSLISQAELAAMMETPVTPEAPPQETILPGPGPIDQ